MKLFKKLFLWLWLLTKRQLHYPMLVLFLMGMPLCAWIVSKIPSMHESGVLHVGLYQADKDFVSTQTIEDLLNLNSNVVSFYVPQSEAELRADIAAGNTECGYIFKEDFTKKLLSYTYQDSILLLTSPSSTIHALTNEIVFSSAFRSFGQEIALNYVKSKKTLQLPDAEQIVKDRFHFYLNGPATFHVTFKTLDEGNELSPAGLSYERTNPDSLINEETITNDMNEENQVFPLRGILAIILLLAGLFGCIQWLGDYENKIMSTMPSIFVLIGRFLYPMILTVLFSASALITLACAGEFKNIRTEIPAMAAYSCLIILFTAALTFLLRRSQTLIAALPVIILSCLIFCPIFIDLSSFIPFIRVVEKCFIPCYYLKMF